ncbi:MAG: hypothetical protein LBQ81_09630 [Zoogloeaceae bacterium]|nr:hypothetical protein [Zoogloeaceae bacterium]
MRNKVCLCLLSVLLTACASQQTQDVSASVSYDPERYARIRLFGQNQRPSIMNVGKDCATGAKGYKVNVGGGFGDAFKSFAGAASNKTLGIPETESTRQLSRKDGLLSKAFYQEFVIPAGTLVQVRAAYIGLTTTLRSPGEIMIWSEKSGTSRTVPFVPEAGKDYEAISTRQDGREFVWIYEVRADGTLQPISDEQPEACGK